MAKSPKLVSRTPLIQYRNGYPLELTVDAGQDPSAKNPHYSVYTLTGSVTTLPDCTPSHWWSVAEYSGGSAPTIDRPNRLETYVTLPNPQTATFQLNAECQSGEMFMHAEDTIVLDRQ